MKYGIYGHPQALPGYPLVRDDKSERCHFLFER